MAGARRTVNVQEAKTHLSRLLRQVEAGEVIAIARAGRVVAKLVRAEEASPRAWGCFEGQVRIDPDAFDPLSEGQASEWERGAAHTMTGILLDTHVFVWGLADPKRIPDAAWPVLRDPAQALFLSVASAWELAIQAGRGKIALPGGVQAFVGEGCRRTGVTLLGIDLAHTAEVERQPHHHRDLFDRMLVAQARVEGLALLSFDPALDAYDVERAAR